MTSGYLSLKRVRSSVSSCLSLALVERAERVTAAGARRFIEKPFDPDELASELAELLQTS